MTQNLQVLAWLKSGKTLTAYEAMQAFGIYRLAARVCELREKGVKVKSEFVQKRHKRFARYSL